MILLALAGTIGCDPETRSPISVLDGRGDLAPSLRREAEALDPDIDGDGDGLVDVDELVGWDIRVDQTARPQGVTTIHVTSDPTMEDTDEDGLPDGLERISGANPNRADTDGDGLDDVDEVQRWGTSPASVDTDGDSRGPDPDASSAPVVTLFDAAELTLIDDPMRPGEMTSAPGASSPLLADTDGDGRWDYDEIGVGRSPVVAEIPELIVQPTPGTTLGTFLDLTATDGSVALDATSYETTISTGSTFTVASSTTMTMAEWLSEDAEASITETAMVGTSIDVSARLKASLRVGFGLSADFSTSLSVSADFRGGMRDFSETTSERTNTTGETISGGRMTVAVDVVNTGDIPFAVRDLRVGAYYTTTTDSSIRPFGTFVPMTPVDTVVAVGETVPGVQLEIRNVETDRIQALIANPRAIMFFPASYEIVDAGEEHYEFVQARMAERTTSLEIQDLGELDGRYAFATNVRRDPEGREEGLSVGEMLTILGIPFSAEPVPLEPPPRILQYLYEVGGERTILHSGPAPDLGDPLPYPEGIDPGPRMLNRGWIALLEARSGDMITFEDLFAARALPGDTLSLWYAGDSDRDGLSVIEEVFVLGTSDETPDTDGDGLSDFFETRVGWYSQVVGEPALHVFSSPNEADADGDGLNDRQELFGTVPRVDGYGVGTRPDRADTDRDGHGDAEEVSDLGDSLDPLRFDDTTPPSVACSHNATRAARAHELVITTIHASDGAAANVDIASVTVAFRDGTTQTFTAETPRTDFDLRIPRAAHGVSAFATDAHGNPTSTVTCTDTP